MRALADLLNPKGKFVVEHFDRFGRLKGRYEMPNGIVNEGKDRILDVMFNNGTVIPNNSWFIGFIDSFQFTALADVDTMASHGGWPNEVTAYSEANRVAWGSGAASAESITNSTPATFNMNDSNTVKGIFVCSNNVKNGSSGLLWATALFAGGDVPVSNGDQLKVTYSVSA